MSGDVVENVDSIRKELAERANEDKLYKTYRSLFDNLNECIDLIETGADGDAEML
jgi:hypothetical protein